MNNSLIAGLVVGGVVLLAVGAYASTQTNLNPWQDYAEVVAVEPAFDNKQTARQVCNDEAVTQQVAVRDEKRIAGSAIGAVVGGVLGHQVGSGDGNKIATAAGAVAGGYAGSKVQKGMQERNTETVVQERCGTVYDNQKVPAGFDVTYLLDGKQGVVRMDRDPGKRIRVEGGELVLT
ncbi:MAG: glycine zipper 2TM domain-containing protein [Steroidobacteraceae bacterium]